MASFGSSFGKLGVAAALAVNPVTETTISAVAAKAGVLITDCKNRPADAEGNKPQCVHGQGYYPKLRNPANGLHKAVNAFFLHDDKTAIVFFCTKKVTAIKGDHLTAGVVGAVAVTPRDGMVTGICPTGNAWQGPSIGDAQIQRTQGIQSSPPPGYDVIEHSPGEPQSFLKPKVRFAKGQTTVAKTTVSFAVANNG